MRSTFTGLACALMAIVGCAPAESDALDSRAGAEAHGSAAADDLADPASVAKRVQHQASGYLEVVDSPILPWCNAVLIAPDVVLTSAHCVAEAWPEQLRFGVGSTAGELGDTVGVQRIVVHPDAETAGHELAALTLEAPIDRVEPVDLSANPRDTCGLSTVANRYRARTDADARRWSWDGCLERSRAQVRLVARRGAPNCHGDEGAGVFVSGSDETLVALSVPSRHDDEPRTTCVDSVALATVADNLDFLDEALDLSRPAE